MTFCSWNHAFSIKPASAELDYSVLDAKLPQSWRFGFLGSSREFPKIGDPKIVP